MVRYGFHSLADLHIQNLHFKQELDEDNDERWQLGLKFFSKLTDLEGHRHLLFKRTATDGQLLDA